MKRLYIFAMFATTLYVVLSHKTIKAPLIKYEQKIFKDLNGIPLKKTNLLAPLIKVKQGTVTGVKEVSENGKKIFHSYYNIPYAEPPINDLRFKDPVPKTPWKGLHDGSKRPQKCPPLLEKDVNGNLELIGSEDCLILNVFTPQSRPSNKKLAVMFYIHGGGFYVGSAYEYAPYVLMEEDIVLVAIQYRLSILGFLSTGDEILPGNMGLKDQQLALKWVNENIASFGGDSNNVTIFGGSAGAASVNFQVFSPGSKGLFQRAIMQGGSALCAWSYTTNPHQYAKAVGEYFNCSMERETQKYVECLQSVEVYQLIEYVTTTSKFKEIATPFVPTIDGVFLPNRPEVLLKNGKYNKVDTIFGVSRDEGASFIFPHVKDPSISDLINENFQEFGPVSLNLHEEESPLELSLRAYKYYLDKKYVNNVSERDFENLVKLYTDRNFKSCHYIYGKYLAEDPEVDIYLYRLDHFGEVSDGVGVPGFDRRNWVNHQDLLYYLFGTGGSRFDTPLTDKRDIYVRNFVVTAWTNFAKHGNPNKYHIPCNCSWNAATKESFRLLRIKKFPEMTDFTFPEFQNFWSKLSTVQNEILFQS